MNARVVKDHTGFVIFLELWCVTDELGKLGGVGNELVGKGYRQGIQQRGIDPNHEIFQIFVDPIELQLGKSGEESACWWRRRSVFDDRERFRGFEIKDKCFKSCQRGEA